MKIWLFNPYGPVPGEGWRDYSFVIAGKVLAASGHEVIWWTSNFSHHFKKFRCDGWSDVEIVPNFSIRYVPTPGYKNNISIARLWRDLIFAFYAYKRGKNESKPNLILCAENPLSFGFPGAMLAKFHKCHLVYDQMDLWPELIVNAFPKAIRWILNLIFFPVFARRKTIFSRLDGAMALAEPYLEVIFKECPAIRDRPHVLIYNGIDVIAFRAAMVNESINLPPVIRNIDVKGKILAIFAGSLGPSYDIETLLSVARRLDKTDSPINIVIAGDGPFAESVRLVDQSCRNLHFLGRLSPDQLARVYSCCDIGLCAYSSKSNVEMPDKFYDYTAAGLAIVNSLLGEISEKIQYHQLGLSYIAGDEDSLYNALTSISSDIDKLSEMQQKSSVVGLNYDSNVQYRKLPLFLEEVIRNDN